MKILVCGSRHFNDWKLLVDTLWEIMDSRKTEQYVCTDEYTIIHGDAKGADSLADKFAYTFGTNLDVYPADWDTHGKAAGPIRNKQMLDEGKPDLVIAFLAPDSRGTKNMIEQATKAGVPVKIVNIASEITDESNNTTT